MRQTVFFYNPLLKTTPYGPGREGIKIQKGSKRINIRQKCIFNLLFFLFIRLPEFRLTFINYGIKMSNTPKDAFWHVVCSVHRLGCNLTGRKLAQERRCGSTRLKLIVNANGTDVVNRMRK